LVTAVLYGKKICRNTNTTIPLVIILNIALEQKIRYNLIYYCNVWRSFRIRVTMYRHVGTLQAKNAIRHWKINLNKYKMIVILWSWNNKYVKVGITTLWMVFYLFLYHTYFITWLIPILTWDLHNASYIARIFPHVFNVCCKLTASVKNQRPCVVKLYKTNV